ncbi:hypothetical protein TVAG_006340 [Trichomonas vaginalis G3]|uniref:Uncharacterized protein n=1 Tax=Trichomonas vaginalis (strain ATCC PRA-98 / G3) TaxID=412133 RepID=A2E741_TRIV3|nr:NHL repeat family [Trichomonas vaginalis G3]EAY11559.1 hypothetical protein TVAG_006340 [Trichomonas vaginalis G3]KAI5489443.1 NHL repeat family [Trichomonas vaginalis G3]|eukprot:XP_001323782.1 hypothetical protein [Trichomonas vaginalis G3]
MSFAVPYKAGPVFDFPGVFKMKSYKKNTYIAMISSDTVYIVDCSDRNLKKHFTVVRDKQSLELYGNNEFIEWIDPKTLAVGSSTNIFFIIKKESGFQFDMTNIPIKTAILDTFACYGYLGIVHPSGNVEFYDKNAAKINDFKMPRTNGRLSCINFQRPSTLSGIFNGAPFFIFLEKKIIEENDEYIYYYLNETDALLSSYNPYYSSVAYSTPDNTVYCCGINSNFQKRFLVADKGFDNVIHLEWIKCGKVLLVFYESGIVISYSIDIGRFHKIETEIMRNSVSISVDSLDNIIFYSDYSKVQTVYIAEHQNSILMSSYGFADYFNEEKRLTLENLEAPEWLYPLKLVIKKDILNTYLIANENGIAIVENDKVVASKQLTVINAAFVLDFVFVFSSNNEVRIIDLKCKDRSMLHLDYKPKCLSVCEDKLCASCESQFTVFSIGKKDNSFEFYKQKTVKCKDLLKGVYICKDTIVVHSADDVCYEYPSNLILCTNIRSCFQSQNPSGVFMNNTTQIVLAYKHTILRFGAHSCFSDIGTLYTPNVKKFGEISYGKLNYLPFCLSYFSANIPVLKELKDLVEKYLQYESIIEVFATATLVSIDKNRLDQYVKAVNNYPNEFLARMYIRAFELIEPEGRPKLHACNYIPWLIFSQYATDEELNKILDGAPEDLIEIVKGK